MTTAIHILDLNFLTVPQAIAAYLVVGPQGPVLVETGPGSTLPVLKNRLAAYGYTVQDIKHILLTHIHFDHAGAAGWWASQGAHIYVHHFGARHLIDPSKLIASATRIYGSAMDTLWGEIIPAPVENVTVLHDGDVVAANGLTFQVIETPGHARHHHVYRLDDIAFTGDAAGVSIPGAGIVDLPAPPPEFDKEAWLTTLDRLEAENLSAIYPTHYGRVNDVGRHLHQLRQLLNDGPQFIKDKMAQGVSRDDLVQLYIAWNQERAVQAGLDKDQVRQYHAANPLNMSVDGIMRYWRKKEG